MVEIKCSGDQFLPLSALSNFQGKLKTLSDVNYNKLRKQIEENGFIVPFFVWQSGEKNYILDGHQRESVLTRMQADGIELPEKYPVVYVHADNRKDAKKKLLAINSQYGKMTQSGLFDFVSDMDMDLSALGEFELPGINIDLLTHNNKFIEANDAIEEFEACEEFPEYNSENLSAKYKIVVHIFNEEDLQEFGKILNKQINENTKFIHFPDIPIENQVITRREEYKNEFE